MKPNVLMIVVHGRAAIQSLRLILLGRHGKPPRHQNGSELLSPAKPSKMKDGRYTKAGHHTPEQSRAGLTTTCRANLAVLAHALPPSAH